MLSQTAIYFSVWHDVYTDNVGYLRLTESADLAFQL